MYIKKMSTNFFSLLLVALLATMMLAVYGCGANDSDTSKTGLVSGGTDVVAGETPEIALLKTIVTRGSDTEVSYHFESNMPLEDDLVVGIRVKTGDSVEGRVLVMPKGTYISEAFAFDNATEIELVHHKDLLDFKWPMLAMNVEILPENFNYPVEVNRYFPFFRRPYTVSAENSRITG